MAADNPRELDDLVDTLLRKLDRLEQGITSGAERNTALLELSLLGAFVEDAARLRRPELRPPTDTLMRVANGFLGWALGTENDPLLERQSPAAKPALTPDIQFGRATAGAVMEFIIMTKRRRRKPAAELVVTMLGSSRLFDGLKGVRWRMVDNWRAAHTGAGTADPDAMDRYRMVLGLLLREVPPGADITHLTVLRRWRKKPAAAQTS